MNPPAKHVFISFALPALAFVLGGCGDIAVSGYGYTPVYGDYGYVGPWDRDQIVVEGAYFGAPPYRSPDRDRREAPAPQRRAVPERAAPVQRAASRPIPSIPNAPRPAPQRGGNDKDRH